MSGNRDAYPGPQGAALRHQWRAPDPAIRRMRAARRRYWAACTAGSPGQIESAVQEWVEAQLGAAESERGALAVLGDD